MKHMCCLLCVLVFIMHCYGCVFTQTTDFYYNPQEISSVEIVVFGDPIPGELGLEESLISRVAEIPAFLEKMNAIERRTNWGEPITIKPGDIAIKIIYLNGEYDLVTWDAQVKCRKEMNHTGYSVFNQQKFIALINEYIDSKSIPETN